jgi:hypothetical protein
MNVRRSFVFTFKSPGAFKKLLTGGVLSLFFFTVFLAFVVAGYLLRVVCDLLEGRDGALPKWDDWPALFNEGLQPVLIALMYFAPVGILYTLGLWIPLDVIPAIQLVLALLASALLPPALIHFITAGDISAAFKLGASLRFICKNPSRFFLAWGLHVALFVAVTVVSSGLCIATAVPLSDIAGSPLAIASGLAVGATVFFFLTFTENVVAAHLFAQVYRCSPPFEDDKEGAVRASMVIPPSLSRRRQ